MTEIIYQHQGTIDKFIGDAVMVIFGAPMPLPEKEQAERAIACARDMLRGMASLNQEFKREFNITIDMRIGINQGPAIVGTFGCEKRSDYTAVGPAVNLASRIENKAFANEIMISPDIARHLSADEVDERGIFKLKGIASEIMLYAVKGNALADRSA
jgi:class 3 adenylate cyclase